MGLILCQDDSCGTSTSGDIKDVLYKVLPAVGVSGHRDAMDALQNTGSIGGALTYGKVTYGSAGPKTNNESPSILHHMF